MHPLLSFFDRHAIPAGWLGTLAALSADAIATLQQADAILSVCIRAVGLAVALLTLAITFRRWHRGD